ncbi:polyketide cyclase [Pedobacter sp. KBW06]|uniref:SRPBCC family protein n=1 Tax=Pedobacter sp. KBW06 TaxID=2153359 RepID=UPI000F593480|nr:SRPBCC family protein [Pedobacter sp. KBW06]RQO75171.1 polyketide cyclase [Pedobacter sp. KBW06]
METRKTPHVEAQMLIRKPAAIVFNAFIDPELTKNFWFTKGSGKLETGKSITWEWEMYGVSSTVFVREIITDRKISVDWDQYSTIVDFEFEPMGDEATYVKITQYGFRTTGDELLAEISGASGGFTTVVDGLKAYLEHGINLNLIADKFPKGVK